MIKPKKPKLPTLKQLKRAICCGPRCLNPIECLMNNNRKEAKRVLALLKSL